jgi:hypothetical protein
MDLELGCGEIVFVYNFLDEEGGGGNAIPGRKTEFWLP